MKTLAITIKTLRELIREPLLLGLMFAFPLILLGIFALAFGGDREGILEMVIFVDNQDQCVMLEQREGWCAGQELVDALDNLEYEGQPVFEVQSVDDPATARTALREHKAAILVTIPADFSRQLATPGSDTARVTLTGDPHSDSYLIAHNSIDQLLRVFAGQLAPPTQSPVVDLQYRSITADQALSDFDFGVGGIIVFGIMFLIISSAEIMVRENVNGTLRRLQLSMMRSVQLLGGVLLSQMLIAILMVPLVLGGALLLGFESSGSLLLAVAIGLLLSLCATGLGLLVACFAHSDGEAVNLATGLLVPFIFLSGALYPMPDANLFKIGGQTFQVYDILPTTHAAAALRRVLVYGDAPSAIAYELIMLCSLSVLFFAVGIIFYQRRQLRRS